MTEFSFIDEQSLYDTSVSCVFCIVLTYQSRLAEIIGVDRYFHHMGVPGVKQSLIV